MTLNKVNYFKLNSDFLNLVRETDLEDSYDYLYKKCPVWKHKSERTYVMLFPIDLKFHLDFSEKKIIIDECSVDSEKLLSLTPRSQPILISQPEDLYGPTPVLQIELPKYLFWCEDEKKDIWIEQLDHPLTSLNNNIILVGGWFNIKNYNRVITLGVRVVDKNKPIILKKGDPVARIRLYSEDLNSGCKLIEKQLTEREFNSLQTYTMNERGNMKKDKSILNNILFGKTQKKCPFRFLFK